MLSNIATSYQPKSNVEATLKCLLECHNQILKTEGLLTDIFGKKEPQQAGYEGGRPS